MMFIKSEIDRENTKREMHSHYIQIVKYDIGRYCKKISKYAVKYKLFVWVQHYPSIISFKFVDYVICSIFRKNPEKMPRKALNACGYIIYKIIK